MRSVELDNMSECDQQELVLCEVISGGQTGVDRAALDAALRSGFRCGGWCPVGRRAEDGPIDARYPLKELASWRYEVRTKQNVADADGTLIIAETPLLGGTRLTRAFARELDKPVLVVPPRGLFLSKLIECWLKEHRIGVMNVAGPRESSCPGIYHDALAIMTELLDGLRQSQG